MFFVKNLAGLVGLTIVFACYWMSLPPRLSSERSQEIAERFAFTHYDLPKISDRPEKGIRQFHPSAQHMAGWLSFVGAAVALGDLDGNGLSDDLVYVDARFDEVTVCPAPTTGDRFEPFILGALDMPYDAKSMAPMGSLIGDFNEDGWQDILVYFWGRSPIIYLRTSPNRADQPLSLEDFRAVELVSPHENWHTSAVTQADLDGDGHMDLVVGNYNPDGSKLLDAEDSSGSREALMASFGRATNGGVTRFMLSNAGNSTGASELFREAIDAVSPEVAGGWLFAVGAADLSGDLLPEIYLVHDWGADRLLFNESVPGELKFRVVEGRRSLLTPRSMAVGLDTFNGMGVDFADINGDGLLDIIVSNITSDFGFHQSSLLFVHTGEQGLFERGIAPFVNQSEAYGVSRGGWAWDAKFADFDNSGTLELMQATGFMPGETNRWPELQELALANEELARYPAIYPQLGPGDGAAADEHNPFFVRDGDRYYDVARSMAGPLGDRTMSRGFAIADVDADGRLDFAVANNWEDSFFFHNQTSQPGQFVGLNLRLALEPPRAEDLQATEAMDADRVVVRSDSALAIAAKGRGPLEYRSLPAIGAEAKVEVIGGEHEPKSWVAQVDGGNGHSGQRAPELHFGLGQLAEGATCTTHIRWRDLVGEIHALDVPTPAASWYTIYLFRVQDAEAHLSHNSNGQ